MVMVSFVWIICQLSSKHTFVFSQNNSTRSFFSHVIFTCLVKKKTNESNSTFSFVFVFDVSVISNQRWSVLVAGSNCLEPNIKGVIRETWRSIWFHWHCLMIMGCNSTLLWSANHTALAWTALNANETWPEYWTAARPRSATPFTPQGTRHMIMAVTLHHLQHC